ncbi:MAG: hypothetical protein EOM12_10530 [Verrucomicrobiae bacterium]|nr:hypothetical protein [Verrucomicrobiae bacterium]
MRNLIQMPEQQRIIRICEWSTLNVPELDDKQCQAINSAVWSWQQANSISEAPLSFVGTNGKTLRTRQYAGVIEVEDVTIEIYPKLDSRLLEESSVEDERIIGSVMSDLLWVLDVSGHMGICEFGRAGLEESPTNFFDIFALLMARQLLIQLGMGVPHAYVRHSDDVRMVREKIRLLDQVTHNMNRMDVIACEWDEFTADIPMNQLIKCSCRFLQSRVRDSGPSRFLKDCIAHLDDIEDVDTLTALSRSLNHKWDRTNERYRPIFELGRRLLHGMGHLLSASDCDTFVFLLDMNKVFEDYVESVLEAYFNVRVKSQNCVGSLFPNLRRGRIRQNADYSWVTREGVNWIGDAKYKHLSKGGSRPILFSQLEDNPNASAELAGNVLSPNDIRQLTVYSELAVIQSGLTTTPNILLIYPYVGEEPLMSDNTQAWNGADFTICPVRMKRQANIVEAFPQGISSVAPR